MSVLLQEDQRRMLIAQARETDVRLETILAPLDDGRLHRQPASGGWSVGQVLEHLIVSDDSYLASMRPLVDDPAAPRASASTTWKASFMGGLLERSLRSERKMPAPKIYRPGPSVRPNAPSELMAREREVLSLLDRAAGLEWQRIRMPSPVMSIIRMNLGDAFAVLVTHTRRHLGQIERIVASTG